MAEKIEEFSTDYKEATFDGSKKERSAYDTLSKLSKTFQREKDNDFFRYLDEAWFSNTLAWLLNPKESHKMGKTFSDKFLSMIALKRTLNFQDKNTEKTYSHSKSNKLVAYRRKNKHGRNARGFDLKNAFPVREFFLSRTVAERKESLPSYIDLVFMDLDRNDSILISIENKLFSTDRKGQLNQYFKKMEEKFGKRVSTREYVYLTLRGDSPHLKKVPGVDPLDVRKNWVCVSWLEDVYKIVKPLASKKPEHQDINKLVSILEWLRQLNNSVSENPTGDGVTVVKLKEFKLGLRTAITKCLLEELNRYSQRRKGENKWQIMKTYKSDILKYKLKHDRYPARNLQVEILPNLTITVRGFKSNKEMFEKVVMPFGCHPDQLYCLLDLTVKEIYKNYLMPDEQNALKGIRTLQNLSEKKQEYREFFNLVYTYSTSLKLLLGFSELKPGTYPNLSNNSVS